LIDGNLYPTCITTQQVGQQYNLPVQNCDVMVGQQYNLPMQNCDVMVGQQHVLTKNWSIVVWAACVKKNDFFSIFFRQVNYIFHKLSVNTKHVQFQLCMHLW
jgi:hypothetical protein